MNLNKIELKKVFLLVNFYVRKVKKNLYLVLIYL